MNHAFSAAAAAVQIAMQVFQVGGGEGNNAGAAAQGGEFVVLGVGGTGRFR